MRTKFSALGLFVLFLSAPVAAVDPTDDQLLYKFAVYTRDVYLGEAMKNRDPNQLSPAVAAQIFTPRMLGYSIGNLLRYARPGSENRRIWLRLESRVRKTLFELIDLQAAQEGWAAAEVDRRKLEAAQEFTWALQHRFDDALAASTGVRPDQAPDFFASLTTPPPQPPIDPPPLPPVDLSDPPIDLSDPLIEKPIPPAPASSDAVAGTYRITGKSHYDANPGASRVVLTGTMDEVEADFKIFDQGRTTWDYKGTAKWNGRSGTDGVRDLVGRTQWVTYPHIFHEQTIKIARGADGVWRATSINIGGNLFLLLQTQAAERTIVTAAKSLTIKNSTSLTVTVFLDPNEDSWQNKIGTVGPRSETTFTGIPERGRWYLKIIPSAETYRGHHVAVLYVKEAVSAYMYEVLIEHFR